MSSLQSTNGMLALADAVEVVTISQKSIDGTKEYIRPDSQKPLEISIVDNNGTPVPFSYTFSGAELSIVIPDTSYKACIDEGYLEGHYKAPQRNSNTAMITAKKQVSTLHFAQR